MLKVPPVVLFFQRVHNWKPFFLTILLGVSTGRDLGFEGDDKNKKIGRHTQQLLSDVHKKSSQGVLADGRRGPRMYVSEYGCDATNTHVCLMISIVQEKKYLQTYGFYLYQV